ncbi:MAG TPA: hypothetical protein VE057_26000 [Archangium sp.]|nr:hypothetical protein [Archangium sp.]
MKRHVQPLSAFLPTVMMLMACGGGAESGQTSAGESLGTQQAALCAGASVTNLSISGISTYYGEMAGSGPWSVTYPANALRLEYYVDGVRRSFEERPGGSGTWYFSTAGLACGPRLFQVTAWPMVIDSSGNRTVCSDSPRSMTRMVFDPCPTAAAGEAHTVALKRDGTLWAWGNNGYGQLADGTTTTRTTPIPISGFGEVAAISAGVAHTVALKQDGTVWAWGANYHGQLGDGTTTTRLRPVQVPGLSGVLAIDVGDDHTVAVKQDGTLWAWGSNRYGQVGDGTTTNRLSPVQIGLSNVGGIAAGTGHTVALKKDGTAWAWGYNYYGQVGDGTSRTNRLAPVQVVGFSNGSAVAAGGFHSAALKKDGTVWTWGDNYHGQIGNGTSGTTALKLTPVQVATNATAIDAGFYRTLTRKQDGTLWDWGYNGFGELGDGTTTHRSSPVQVVGMSNPTSISAGQYHSVAVKPDGTVWAWGAGYRNQLGDGTSTDRRLPVQVPGLNLQ